MARDISNADDVVDSRDVIARIGELQDEYDALAEALKDIIDDPPELEDDEDEARETEVEYQESKQEAIDALREWLGLDMPSHEIATAVKDGVDLLGKGESDDADELKVLLALADECDGYAADWFHGATLIRESYFTRYCEELCKDIGDLPKEIPHYIEIDWEKTANNLRIDYTEVDWDGVTYLIR